MWKYAAGAFSCMAAYFMKKYYFAGGVCRCTTRLDKKVVIITGANSGIGKSLAFELAKRGAIVILACRSVSKGNSVKESIIKKFPKNTVIVKELDLASFSSIFNFTDWIKSEYHEIYALVNNAAVFYHPQQLTEDKFDVTFQTNYLGPFVLTHQLCNVLKDSDYNYSRIVNVTSEANNLATLDDLNNLTRNQEEPRCHFKAYGVSKLALILFTNALTKKLSDENILINAVNPGNVESNIFRHFPFLSNKYLFALQWPIRIVVIKTPNEGCQTVLHSILTTDKATGKYLTDCKPASPNPIALDSVIVDDYYNLTLEVLPPNVKLSLQ